MRLRRILLDSVGHADARFDPLLLDFRGTSGQALDTVLWLRNAGGKTSLLSLVFSVLQPNRNQFLGYLQKGRAKSVDKYVLPDDVAHVVLEWQEDGLPGFGAPFVTAAVMAVRTEGGAEDRLARFWYAFRPVEGTFGLDDLPIREGRRRTPYRRYRQLLEELAGRHAATELVVRDHQAEWLDYLDRNQIDPEMFRYQLSMNKDEGGAVKLLESFSDADSFVDFLVDVVSDPTDAAEVLQNLAQVAGKIEMRPRREREREFIAGTIERLRPLADAHGTWRKAREEHQRVVLDGSRLRRRIAQAAAAADELARQQADEAASKKREYDAAERLRSQLDRQANALQVERLRFEVAELADAAAAAHELEEEARRLARAWEAAETVAELSEVESLVARLRRELAREIEDAADLRGEYELAAMRLRGHVVDLAGAATRDAEHAEAMAEASEKRRSAEDALEKAAGIRVAEVGVELRQLEQRLDELDRQLALLARDGQIERGETATAALVRVRRQDLGARARLEAIPAERATVERDRAAADAEVRRLGVRIADLRGRHERLRGDRDRLLERARELGEDGRVLELDEVAGHRDADRALLQRLRQLLDDCPPGHLDGLAHELEQQATELDELDRRSAGQEEAARAAGERLRDLGETERRLNAERMGHTAAIGRLGPVAVAEEQRAGWSERRAALDDERGRRLDEQDRARLARDEAQRQAKRWAGDATQARNDARIWLREVEELPSFDVDAGAAEEGLDALRVAYQTLRDRYERRTTKSDLARRAEAESRRAGQVGARLHPFGEAVVARARELLATPGAQSAGFRAERLVRARRDLEEATAGRIRAEEDRKRAENDLTRLTRETRNLTTLPDELRPVDRAHAGRLLEEVSARMAREKARRDSADGDQRTAAARSKDATHEHELLASEERHLAQTLAEEGVESQATYGPISADEARREVAKVVGALQGAAAELTTLEEERRRAANRVRQFAGLSEYDELDGPYRERLTDPDDRALAARAEDDLGEFERRLPFLDHQLAEIERHQARVAERLLVQVDDALQNLRWLQRQEMPDGLGQWSGQHYFHIRYDLPETHDERKLRVQVLLDEVVAARVKLRGTDLVQRALRRVNRRPHFEVDVLKPNEGLRPERAGVSEIGAWSGGQKLTTAILIYCALARLRADNRSQQRSSPVGVLLLDNPIGTANLSTLIDLQRLVAEKFGVQLVYTTGIDDKPALAPFTNVVRLGNRRERRRERGHIVVEDPADGDVTVVEAARVFRRDVSTG